MSQSQSSQGNDGPNINDIEGDVNIDSSRRSVEVKGNEIKGAGSVGELKGSGYTEGNIYYIEGGATFNPPSDPQKRAKFPNNLPLSGVKAFVGREEELATLHQRLQETQRIAITAVTGMGGIGKTELALQYATDKRGDYPGGVCWLPSRDTDVGLGVLNFARVYLGLHPSEELSLGDRVRFCWTRWPTSGDVLVILDDVIDYQKVKPFLPPDESRFKVIVTTRQKRLSHAFENLDLPVLSEGEALELLQLLIGKARVNAELERAKALCAWLGYLPLGLELTGQYLAELPDLSLLEIQEELESEGLQQEALTEYTSDATAQRGVKAAFELSWRRLSQKAKELAYVLSLFAVAPIFWEWVEDCFSEEKKEFKKARDRLLVKLSLLERLDGGWFQVHPLLHRFMGDKLADYAEVERLKREYCRVMVGVSQTMPQTPNVEEIKKFGVVVPHLQSVAVRWYDWVEDEDLIWAFLGMARYYNEQGLYSQAEPYYRQCVSVTGDRLGEEHPDVATSLNNLAGLYESQGRYSEAEPLYSQALELMRKLLGKEHPDVATSLNNLAFLYKSQGRYTETEPLYFQSLELRRKLLGEEHPDVATSLNNLAELYRSQGRYTEAEPLYSQALELRRKLLGKEHPSVATSLNNLAGLYKSQGRYTEAEPLYSQALELRRKLLGEEHPDVTSSLNNLAELYRSQGRYTEAEPLYSQSLELRRKLLGKEHPSVATSLNNLAALYKSQGRYTEAEPLYSQAITILLRRLGVEHPNTQTVMGNFKICLQSAVAAGQRDKLSNHPITQQLLAQIE
ncbi:MAG: tetratricopeptide repeat protein [Cyanobacteria bacterium P01_E01_bin.42]